MTNLNEFVVTPSLMTRASFFIVIQIVREINRIAAKKTYEKTGGTLNTCISLCKPSLLPWDKELHPFYKKYAAIVSDLLKQKKIPKIEAKDLMKDISKTCVIGCRLQYLLHYQQELKSVSELAIQKLKDRKLITKDEVVEIQIKVGDSIQLIKKEVDQLYKEFKNNVNKIESTIQKLKNYQLLEYKIDEAVFEDIDSLFEKNFSKDTYNKCIKICKTTIYKHPTYRTLRRWYNNNKIDSIEFSIIVSKLYDICSLRCENSYLIRQIEYIKSTYRSLPDSLVSNFKKMFLKKKMKSYLKTLLSNKQKLNKLINQVNDMLKEYTKSKQPKISPEIQKRYNEIIAYMKGAMI